MSKQKKRNAVRELGHTREYKIRKNSVVQVTFPDANGNQCKVAIDVPDDLLLSRFRVTTTPGAEVKVIYFSG